MRGKIKNEHLYENVPKLIKTSHEVKLTTLESTIENRQKHP